MTRTCKYCNKEHEIYYLIMVNNTKHLAYSCPNKSKKGKLIRVYISMIKDLDLPIQYTEKYKRAFDIKGKQLSFI